MLKSEQRMLNALDVNGIQYCHWKSNEHLEPALCGDTDLDILFLPEQRSEIDGLLNSCGVKRFRATPLMQYNAIEDYIGFDEETAKIWHLHLHYRLTLGEKYLKGYTITPWTEYVIAHRILSPLGIYTSNPECELVLLLVRISLKLRWRDFGRTIGKDDMVEMAWLKERVNQEKLSQTAIDMMDVHAAELVTALASQIVSEKRQLLPLKKELRRCLKPYTFYSVTGSWWMRTKREVFWLQGGVVRRLGWNSTTPSRRISPSGGTVVVFIGCDGSGKSTTIANVQNELKKKLDVTCQYMGSGDGSSSILRKPMKLLAKKVGGKGLGRRVDREYNAYKEGKKKLSLKSRLYTFAKIIWAVTLALEKKRKLGQITQARNNGMIILCDRYPQTEQMGYGDGPLLYRYLGTKGILKKLADWEYGVYASAQENKPDLAIKLKVPTEIATARKPEMTVEEIEKKKEIVHNMNISLHEIEVDTSDTPEEAKKIVMKEIWHHI